MGIQNYRSWSFSIQTSEIKRKKKEKHFCCAWYFWFYRKIYHLAKCVCICAYVRPNILLLCYGLMMILDTWPNLLVFWHQKIIDSHCLPNIVYTLPSESISVLLAIRRKPFVFNRFFAIIFFSIILRSEFRVDTHSIHFIRIRDKLSLDRIYALTYL